MSGALWLRDCVWLPSSWAWAFPINNWKEMSYWTENAFTRALKTKTYLFAIIGINLIWKCTGASRVRVCLCVWMVQAPRFRISSHSRCRTPSASSRSIMRQYAVFPDIREQEEEEEGENSRQQTAGGEQCNRSGQYLNEHICARENAIC